MRRRPFDWERDAVEVVPWRKKIDWSWVLISAWLCAVALVQVAALVT